LRILTRAVSALAIASLLAACSGGAGTSSLPSVPTGVTPDVAPGDFVAMGSFAARGDENASIHFLPTVDSFPQPVRGVSGDRTAMAGSNNLIYGSGPVQTAPKLYVVFWGSAWNGSGDPNGLKSLLPAFLAKVGGSAWNSTVTQYTMSGGAHAGNPAGNYGGSYVDTTSSPAKRPTQSQMAAEAAKAAAHFGDRSSSAEYIVAMPHGIVPSGFKTQYCAYHATTTSSGSTISWTNLPYLPDAGTGCGANSVAGPNDGVSIVEGHEMAESETDPQLGAWLDSSGAEIGDKCAWVNLQETNLNGTNYPTQPLWSNAVSGCVQ